MKAFVTVAKTVSLITLLLIGAAIEANSQESLNGESDVKDRAIEFFGEYQYDEALPLFAQLLSLYPKDPIYNYCYGICLVEENKDVDEAIRYLKYASTKQVKYFVYFYLGKAHHISYDFDQAIKYYKIFLERLEPGDMKDYPADRMLEMCNNGKELVKYVSDLVVLDNKKLKSEDFFYSYDLEDFGGKIIVKPDDFKTKIDKKLEERSIMFLPKGKDYAFISSYGDDKKSKTKDIYIIKRQPDNTWGGMESVGEVINSYYDEDYPYIRPDGKTLYFCSKGHNSMGGYDVFKSVYDSTSSTWSKPENMDFPTNTPYDDILFITDKNEDLAFFASNRETGKEEMSVYKIVVEKNPQVRAIQSIDEIKQKAKMEVSAPVAKVEKPVEEVVEVETDYYKVEFDALALKEGDYNFQEFTLWDDATKQDVTNEAEKDVKILDKASKELNNDANIAFLIAQEKNRVANDKLREAGALYDEMEITTDEGKRSHHRVKADQLESQASILAKSAIAAYNLANILDKAAKEKEKDAAFAKNYLYKVKSNTTKDPGTIIADINDNRKRYNQGKKRFTSANKVLHNKKELSEKTYAEYKKAAGELKTERAEQKKVYEAIQATSISMNQTSDINEKYAQQEKLDNLKSDFVKVEEKVKKLNSQAQKLKVEAETLNTEVIVLSGVVDDINSDEKEYEIVANLASQINKEELDQQILDKEFVIEKSLAEQVDEEKNEYYVEEDIAEAQPEIIDKEEVQAIVVPMQPVEKEAEAVEVVDVQPELVATQEEVVYAPVVISEPKVDEARLPEKEYASEEAQKRIVEATINRQIADSLYAAADQKRAILDGVENPEEIARVEQEIRELEEIAGIKEQQAMQKYKQAQAEEKTYLTAGEEVTPAPETEGVVEVEPTLVTSKESIKKAEEFHNDNPAFAFSGSDPETKVGQYERELFKAAYYSSVISELEPKIEHMENNLAKVQDEETKQLIREEITKQFELLAYYKHEAELTQGGLSRLKKDVYEEIDEGILKPEELLLNAAAYEPEARVEFNVDQEFQLKSIDSKRVVAASGRDEWSVLMAQLDDYDVKIESEQDERAKKLLVKEKVALQKKVDKKTFYFNATYSQANKSEYDLYKEQIDEMRIISSNKEIRLANTLEKQTELYFEKAELIRKDAQIIEEDRAREEYQLRANTLELLAIENQKHALDIYIVSQGTDELVAEEQVEVKREEAPKEITLLYEEEQQLKQAREEENKALVIEGQAIEVLADVNKKKKAASELYSEAKKSKMLKGVDEAEAKAKQDLRVSYYAYSKSDSIKYAVYEEQLEQMQKIPEVNNNNKLIAKQYIKEADFYYSNATTEREKANSIADIDEKLKVLAKAKVFEDKATSNQEIAVDVLMSVEPVMFASTNPLTKIDRLDILNQPVNVSSVERMKTDKIIEKLNLEDRDLRVLDEAREDKIKAERKIKESESLLSETLELERGLSDIKDKKEKEKVTYQIENNRGKAFDKKLSAQDDYESYNDARYEIYEENIAAHRIKNNSQESRQARQLEKNAVAHYRKAQSLREKSFDANSQTEAYQLLLDAKEQEELAIVEQEKAYGIYLQIPSEEELIVEREQLINGHAEKEESEESEKGLLVVKSKADVGPVGELPVKTIAVADAELAEVEEEGVERQLVAERTEGKAKEEIVTETEVASVEELVEEMVEVAAEAVEDEVTPVVEAPEEKAGIEAKQAVAEAVVKEEKVTQKQIQQSLFYVADESIYSEVNPIPVNAEMPSDIIFKVQIGAFKIVIPQDAFKGLSPITGEKAPKSQYTKYMVGSFRTIEAAREVLTDVRDMGYDDAFIVSYKNGTRMSLFEARNEVRSGSGEEVRKYQQLAESELNAIKGKQPVSTVDIIKTVEPDYPTIENQVQAENVKNISGLMYTVQVGVFKKLITADKLYDLSPIYKEQTQYGFTRYTKGIYDNYEEAVKEKTRIVNVGIKDAFVSAYFNGKRMRVSEAQALANQQGQTVFAESTEKVAPEVAMDIEVSDITFKVQIGAYKEDVPTDVVSMFLTVASTRGLDQQKGDEGITIYTVGNYVTYIEATDLKKVMIDEGIEGAFVVAFSKGNKVSVSEAKRLLNQ